MSATSARSTGHRLEAGGRIDRARPLRFSFNGRTYTGFEGDTLASALLANGVQRVGRSWKYHRPRGLLAAGVEEPNGLVQLFEGARTVPNARMTEIELFDGLVARTVNARPGVEFDLRAIYGHLSPLIPAGFYYKTFMASLRLWHFFEKHLRAAGGLGESPREPDPDRYEKRFAHADLLVVGGGAAGLSAALAAGEAGARVVLCDEQAEFGGWLLSSDADVQGIAAAQWVAQAVARLAAMPQVRLLRRTTAFGCHEGNFVTLLERRTDHLGPAGTAARECLWKLRAQRVVLATGAHERPLVFANNDLPGVMLASAASTWTRRYAVRLGTSALVFTNNDHGYDAAFALRGAGARVVVVDAREAPAALAQRAAAAGIEVRGGHVVFEAQGRGRVAAARVQRIDAQGRLVGSPAAVPCDVLAMSGGFSPVIHLQSQGGGKPVWDGAAAAFLAAPLPQQRSAGACRGLWDLQAAAGDGACAGAAAAEELGFEVPLARTGAPAGAHASQPVRPLWLVPHPKAPARAPKQFVDFQNDVSAADLLLAVREGFESIEHVKRYTALGFGTDQGKTGNVNGAGIVAQALGTSIDKVGTTTFRPNYTPVSFGAVAGIELGEAFEPVRTTAIHGWHAAQGALFEDVGQWKRPWYYPRGGESMAEAVRREVLAARHGVATLDASTLGKIDIQGPDAVTLLNWVYTNAWSKLEIGKCRYGLMLDENGMVFDDGVTARLGEQHFLMHTTTGGAARVLAWLERWLQTEWPHLKVYLTTVTDHWATTAVVGPRSRDLLNKLCSDVDFGDAAFPFMAWREGTVAGVAARIMRISFSGERSYEVSVPARQGLRVWQAIQDAGAPFGVTPYGTEAMHVLRAEKGYIIVGQDTDGSVTPLDLGLGAMVAKTKDCLGKRSLARTDTARADRKQFVGLLSDDPRVVLPEGAQLQEGGGHVTSSYDSPTLGRSIALALVRGGLGRMGEKVVLRLRDGTLAGATIASPVFFDPQGERQHA